MEELLRISRDKVASGFTDEIKGTSCLQNKLMELQVSIRLSQIYFVPKLLFSHLSVTCIEEKGACLQPGLLEGKSKV